MPSFLNKVFGYKKHDDKETSRPSREGSDNTLLDGKYEAISPVVSPSAVTFAEAQSSKDAERDPSFSLFRPKSRGVYQKPPQKRPDAVPQLTLHLPGPKENLDSRALGVAFEADPGSQLVLDDAVIGAKRLSPLETLILIRACAQAITERGLETLGIMHPHWFSASPDVQRKLISLFIHSLTPQTRITTLSPTPTSSVTAFENELHYTRSPHDVAAVLRWGLRHLSLENGPFGKDSIEWAWYNAFFNAERDASYPPRGFSQLLLPQLPPSHIELLVSTLTLISALASHAEANSISGSKLSKFLGLWLLAATRSEQSDDWDRFYARWERAGRILEHLFLARLREESLTHRLPTRLQELVKYYPYNNKGSPATEQDLLSRPRFSTVQYDTLFVRVETLLTHTAEQPRQHPVQLIAEALQLPTNNLSGNEYIELWNAIKAAASDSGSSAPEGPQFTRIFADDTIQLLSLIPADSTVATSPILLASPILSPKRSSSSLAKIIEHAVSRPKKSNGSAAVSPTSPVTPMITDWAQFSMSGFGETPVTQPISALFDQDDDLEVTQPQISRKPSRQRGTSRTRRRRSEDNDLSATPSTQQLSEPEPIIIETKLASVHIIQIDEAFIDFWSDAIVDPISADWPTFVVCGLKVVPSVEKPIRWLVIEQIYTHEEPSPPPRVPSPEAGTRGRSPRPSFRSDISGFRIGNMFSSTRKRFSVFSKSATDLTPKKSTGKSPKVGELGEILAEEEPSTPTVAEGSNHVEIAITTPAVVNGTTSGKPTPAVAPAKLSFTADVAASADQTPTTDVGQVPEVKEQLEHKRAKEPSAVPQHRHDDLLANLESIKPSEEVVTTVEVVSQSTLTGAPVDVVDGSLIIVSSPSAAETETTKNGAVPHETSETRPQIAPETLEVAVVVAEVAPVVEDKVPEPVVEEAQVPVEVEQLGQSVVVVPVEVPAVEVAGEINESVVLVEETPAPQVVVETSEPVVIAARLEPEPEPVEEKVVEPVVEETQVSVQIEEPSQEAVAAPEPEPAETPVVVETEAARPALEASASDAVEAPQEVVQEVEVATPVPETVTLVEETPGQDTCGDANQPEPEVVAATEEVAPAPAPAPAPEPEQFVEETTEPVVEEPQAVVVEEEPSQDAVADETIEAQVPEPESAQEAVVEEPSVEVSAPAVEASEPAEVAPAVVVEPEPAVDEAIEVVEEVQAPVEEETSQDATAQPAEEPSAPEPEAVDDVPAAAASAAEELAEEVIVAEAEAQPAPEGSVEESEPAEPAPAIVAEPEHAVRETPEPVEEEARTPIEAEEPVPAPSTEPVAEEVSEEIVAVEEAAETVPEAPAEVVEDVAVPEAVEEVVVPAPAVDVVPPTEPAEDKAAEPIAEEEPAPVAAEEVAALEPVAEASESVVVAEPAEGTEEAAEPESVEDNAPEPLAEKESAPIVVEDVASPEPVKEVATPSEPVIEASEPAVVAEFDLAEDKAPEPPVEEREAPVEAVEPPVESVPLVEENGEDAAAPASEQGVAAEVVAVELAAEPEPDVVDAEVEAVDEPQEVAQESEPAPPVETTVLVEEVAVPETIEPAALAPGVELSEAQASEPVAEEVEVAAEAQESSEEPIPAVPSQEPESTVVPEEAPIEQPVEVVEEPAVKPVSVQVEVQPEAIQSEPEAAPFVEDEDAEPIEDAMPTEPSVLEVDVPAPEPPAPADDATPEEA